MKKLQVYFCGWGQEWLLGTLAHAERIVMFEYSSEALDRRIEFSPLKLGLRKAGYQGFPAAQDYLPGLIADALPDGWGRRLMDRCFIKDGRDPRKVSPLERLAFIHDRAMGAFVFKPADELSGAPEYIDLLTLAKDAQLVLAGKDTDTLKQLALTGGSPHGARPKALVNRDSASGRVSTLPADPGEPWLVKFQAEGEAKEVCAIEDLYATQARACGLDMPETAYFDLSAKLSAFGIARFDRFKGMRIPTLSLAGLLDKDFRIPSEDYNTLLKATRMLTRDEREVRKAFERCIFNVIFHNRDDHTKNFAFVMNAAMEWKLAPCFDLTYNQGPGGEHQMTIQGEGHAPGRQHLLELARNCDVPQDWATQAIERIAGTAGLFAAESRNHPIKRTTARRIAADIEANRARMLD